MLLHSAFWGLYVKTAEFRCALARHRTQCTIFHLGWSGCFPSGVVYLLYALINANICVRINFCIYDFKSVWFFATCILTCIAWLGIWSEKNCNPVVGKK